VGQLLAYRCAPGRSLLGGFAHSAEGSPASPSSAILFKMSSDVDRLPIRSLRIALWIGKEARRGAAYEWEPAMKNVIFVGLYVHAETIAVAVAEADGPVRSLGVMSNRAV